MKHTLKTQFLSFACLSTCGDYYCQLLSDKTTSLVHHKPGGQNCEISILVVLILLGMAGDAAKSSALLSQ